MKKSIVHKLKQTRKKVSGKWYNYSVNKAKILTDDSLSEQDKYFEVKNLLKVTRKEIKGEYQDYRDTKAALLTKSDITNFRLTKIQDRVQIQKYYTAPKDYDPDDLETLISELLDRDKVMGVTVIMSVYDAENDVKKYASEFVTTKKLESIYKEYNSIYEFLADKIKKSKTGQIFEDSKIYLRVIYAK
jgi:hypothetical protein